MSADEKPNDAPWEPTPPGGQPATGNELELLALEAENAKAAIVATLHDLKNNLQSAADVERWAREHPWMAVGLASLAGFAAANALKEGVLHTSDLGGASMSPEAKGVAEPASDAANPTTPQAGRWAWLAQPVFELLKIAVEKYAAALAQSPSRPAEARSPDDAGQA